MESPTKKFKGRSHDLIDTAIVAFEENHFGSSSSKQKPYKEFRKLRLVRTSVIFKSILSCLFKRLEQSDHQIMLTNWREFWLAVTVYIFGRTHNFHSEADIIHVRNNLSLCYFEKRIRAKILLGGKRKATNVDNEYRVVNALTQCCPELKIPKIKVPLKLASPTYFCDELVNKSGRRVSGRWVDDQPVISEMFAELVKLYYCIGIETVLLRDNKPEIYDRILNDFSSFNVDPSMSKSDLKILFGKKMIVSQTHGDFSIGNVMTTKSGVVIVDWELSKRHFIADDFRKTLRAYPQSKQFLENCFEELLQHAEIACASDRGTFEEQLLLNEFMFENNILLEG